MAKNKKLELRKSTLKTLTSEQLKKVAGGRMCAGGKSTVDKLLLHRE